MSDKSGKKSPEPKSSETFSYKIPQIEGASGRSQQQRRDIVREYETDELNMSLARDIDSFFVSVTNAIARQNRSRKPKPLIRALTNASSLILNPASAVYPPLDPSTVQEVVETKTTNYKRRRGRRGKGKKKTKKKESIKFTGERPDIPPIPLKDITCGGISISDIFSRELSLDEMRNYISSWTLLNDSDVHTHKQVVAKIYGQVFMKMLYMDLTQVDESKLNHRERCWVANSKTFHGYLTDVFSRGEPIDPELIAGIGDAEQDIYRGLESPIEYLFNNVAYRELLPPQNRAVKNIDDGTEAMFRIYRTILSLRGKVFHDAEQAFLNVFQHLYGKSFNPEYFFARHRDPQYEKEPKEIEMLESVYGLLMEEITERKEEIHEFLRKYGELNFDVTQLLTAKRIGLRSYALELNEKDQTVSIKLQFDEGYSDELVATLGNSHTLSDLKDRLSKNKYNSRNPRGIFELELLVGGSLLDLVDMDDHGVLSVVEGSVNMIEVARLWGTTKEIDPDSIRVEEITHIDHIDKTGPSISSISEMETLTQMGFGDVTMPSFEIKQIPIKDAIAQMLYINPEILLSHGIDKVSVVDPETGSLEIVQMDEREAWELFGNQVRGPFVQRIIQDGEGRYYRWSYIPKLREVARSWFARGYSEDEMVIYFREAYQETVAASSWTLANESIVLNVI